MLPIVAGPFAAACCGAARLHGRAYPSGSDTAARCIRRRRLHRANGSAILGYVRRCIRAARQRHRCVAAAVGCARQRSRGAWIHWACVSAVGGFTHVLYPSTVVTNTSVSGFRGNTTDEVTEVYILVSMCERGERPAHAEPPCQLFSASTSALAQEVDQRHASKPDL